MTLIELKRTLTPNASISAFCSDSEWLEVPGKPSQWDQARVKSIDALGKGVLLVELEGMGR